MRRRKHATPPAVTNAFDAAVRYLPDHSCGAPRQPELDTIRADITTNDLGQPNCP